MRIAVVAPSALPSRRANAIQTVQMAQAFARLGHEVLLVGYPSPPAPLPEGEGGIALTPDPSPTGRGGGALTPGPSPIGQGEAALNPGPSPTGRREPPSPPTPLPQGEGSSPHTQPLSQRAKGVDWEALAEEYGLEARFEVQWLKARSWARRYDFALQAIWAVRRWGADYLFTRLPQAAAGASFIGIPTIFEVHDLPRGAAAQFFRLFLLGKGAKRVVAISKALAEDLVMAFPSLRRFPEAFLVVAPDGVDLRRYTPLLSPIEARQRLCAEGWEIPSGFVAGYTGHLYPGRGAELILSLAAAVPRVHFLIVGGEAEQRQKLEQQFKAQGLSNYTLTGLVAPQQVSLFQMASDVLLMPYQARVAASSGGDIARYLSPMKLFEYLASGRPILASDLAVLREVLNDTNAILLPVGEERVWERALRGIMENSRLAQELAKGARQTAERYCWENRAALILSQASDTQAGL